MNLLPISGPSYRMAYGLILTLLLISSTGQAQVSATLFDINPNRSSLDNSDPDGASGGRVNGLGFASDGSAYYAASEWGGIYKSTDGGDRWFRLNGHRPVATWDVEVDPSNNNRVYATSFYDGRTNSLAGINVSTNGGTSWINPATVTPPPPPYTSAARAQEHSAFGIAIDPNDNRDVYIGTNAGLAISTDAGLTWNYVDPTPGNEADDIWDVIVHNGGIIDIVGDDGHMRSVDGGQTWLPRPPFAQRLPSGRASIAVSPHESYVLFAVVGTSLFQSTDAGQNWTAMTNPRPQGRIPFVATNQRTATTYDVWFGDVSLWRTTATTPASPSIGGAGRAPANSWSSGFTRAVGGHDDCADIVFDPTVANNACPVLFASDGGVYRNTDTGGGCHSPSWEQPTVTPHGLWVFGMGGAPQGGAGNEDLYFGNQDNGSFASTNAETNSPNWTNRECCDGFDVSATPTRVLYTICCNGGANPTRLFLRGQGMTGGSEINNYPPGNLPTFGFDDILDQYAPNDYVIATSAGVFITTNISVNPTWTALGAGSVPANLNSIQTADDGGTPVFYVRDGNGRYWSYRGTGAATWTQVNRPAPTGGFGIFTVDPSNADRLFASYNNGALTQMVLSEDGGATWRNVSQLDILMTGKGLFNYRTTIGPTSFTGFGGYTQPTLVAFDPADEDILVAGATDAGLFVSNDGGVCWTLVTDPFTSHTSGVPHISRPRFAYFSHQAPVAGNDIVHLYVGTQGRGVWRVNLTLSPAPTTTATAIITEPDCPGACTGSINLTPSGGNPPFTYRWSTGAATQDVSGLCEGTYTVIISDQRGCVEYSFDMPDGVDLTPPVIDCRVFNLSCEEPNDPAATGEPNVTDDCGVSSLVHSDVIVPGSCPGNYTIRRTWTAVDVNGNSSNCLEIINVTDEQGPVLTIPPDITVACDTTTVGAGMATTVDNCDPAPSLSYSDVVTSGDCEWQCFIDRTWTTTDWCDNTTTAVQKIEKNVLPLIEEALNKDVDLDGKADLFVMGITNETLSIPPGAGACVLHWMLEDSPGTPWGLKRPNQATEIATCTPGSNTTTPTGGLDNPLLKASIELALHLRLDADLAERPLSDFPCTIAPIVMQVLRRDPVVGKLMKAAHESLGNLVLVPHRQELLDALHCINAELDICESAGQ